MFKRNSKEKDVLQKANEVLELAENALMKAEACYAQIEYEKNLLFEALKKFVEKNELLNAKVEVTETEISRLGEDKPSNEIDFALVNKTEPNKPRTLKTLREGKGFSLRDVANKIGCSKSSVLNWEQGVVKPPFAKAVCLADLFGCTIPEIEDAIQKTADERYFSKKIVSATASSNALDLRGLRQKHGYYQSDIAKKLRVSATTVSAWETGANRIQAHSISALSSLYGVSREEVESAAKKSYKGEY